MFDDPIALPVETPFSGAPQNLLPVSAVETESIRASNLTHGCSEAAIEAAAKHADAYARRLRKQARV
jgi:hypothetical protein